MFDPINLSLHKKFRHYLDRKEIYFSVPFFLFNSRYRSPPQNGNYPEIDFHAYYSKVQLWLKSIHSKKLFWGRKQPPKHHKYFTRAQSDRTATVASQSANPLTSLNPRAIEVCIWDCKQPEIYVFRRRC